VGFPVNTGSKVGSLGYSACLPPHPLGVRVESGRGRGRGRPARPQWSVQCRRVRGGCKPLWRAFLPCRKRASCAWHRPFSQKPPGPIRAVAALDGLDGESPLFRARPARPARPNLVNHGGRSAQAACLVLALICPRLPWIPFAKFGFAFARVFHSRLPPSAARVSLDTVLRKQRASKGQANACMDIQSLGRR
jgi:hypothetical protein